MNFTFENQNTYTYLVYKVAADDAIDTMSLGMVTNNKIPGLASTLFIQMDADKYIKYDVSAKISVRKFFYGPVNRKRLLGVFNGIVDAMMAAEDYMLDANTILLDLDYIFTDVSTCETVLICLPIDRGEAKVTDMCAFFRNIMFSTQFEQTENCDHVARIINYLNSNPVFSLVDFKKVLMDIEGDYSLSDPMNYLKTDILKQQNRESQQLQPPVQPQQQIPQQVQTPPQPKLVTPVIPQGQTPVTPMPGAMPQGKQPVNNSISSSIPEQQQIPRANSSEKQISMFNLLMHYSKENAELYKAQKAAKKGRATTVEAPAKKESAKKASGKKGAANQGVAIPGQKPSASQGFAIPGQKAPASQGGFAVPGQSSQPIQPATAAAVPPVQPAKPTGMPVPQVQRKTEPAQYRPPVMPQGKSMNFDETSLLVDDDDDGGTTVLGVSAADVQIRPFLHRIKTNEKIYIDKPVFRIGKERSFVDYFVVGNSAISRSHADIITRNGEYFVVDNNSTNHTYVDGAILTPNVETRISYGSKIRLANEEFEFKLY